MTAPHKPPRLTVMGTGAGNPSAATFAVALQENPGLARAGFLANAAAVIAHTRVGAPGGFPHRHELGHELESFASVSI